MTNTAIKKTLYLVLPVLFILGGCTDELEIAATQAKGGAYKIAVESYKDYLKKHPGYGKAAELHFEIGLLQAKDNRKEEALLSFKTAVEAGYPPEKARTALRELIGDIATPNLKTTREVLLQVRDVNEDFKEFANVQLLRLDDLESAARRMVSLAREQADQAKFDEARETVGKAKVMVPGIVLAGAAELLKEIPLKEAAYAYEQDLKSSFYFFDKTRKLAAGPGFTSAKYDRFKKLESEDNEKRREIDNAIQYKALGKTEKERRENELTPGLRYKDFLNRKYAMKFTVNLPEYDTKRRGYDISAQYETWPCRGLELAFPVLETDENRGAALAQAKTPVIVEFAFYVVPKNFSKSFAKETFVPGCQVLSGRASLDGKTVYPLKK
ncbi:MAG: hypothetical protein A3J79_12815 [Elusimicrobia bacterium RIFOXYB2_FULL_62_6]|nr:MAG: hypothetical protein A3J79_12815 [Elusimicrobia bacterium RIFOXYB2_FULL_62_6]